MGVVMVKCPAMGLAFSTGIEADAARLFSSGAPIARIAVSSTNGSRAMPGWTSLPAKGLTRPLQSLHDPRSKFRNPEDRREAVFQWRPRPPATSPKSIWVPENVAGRPSQS
jgi:hypothetical protein